MRDFCERMRTEPSGLVTESVPERCVTLPLEAAIAALENASARSSGAPAKRLIALLRQDDRVAQHDVGAANLDIAAHLQVLHDAAHHLARGADHLGDVLLGQPLGHDLLAI